MISTRRYFNIQLICCWISRAIGSTLWFLLVFGTTPLLAQRPPALTPVEVVPIVSRIVQEEISFIATLEPDITTTIGAVVSGRVTRASVREGDSVVAGKTILVQLDRTSRQIALKETKAAVDKARQKWEELKRGYRSEEIVQRRAEVEEQKALLARAEHDFRRAERLYRNELISLAEFERHQSDFLAAKEKHKRVRAALQLVEAGPRKEEIAQAEAEFYEAKARQDLVVYELSRTTLYAPLTGFLIKKYVEIGTWVNPGDPIADLIDLDPVYASGPVGERKIGFIRKGLPATVLVDALPGKSFHGIVSYIIPQADPQSHTFPVKVSISNSNGRLKSGMLARVKVKVGEGRRGFLVPKDSVVRRGTHEVIFIVNDGSAREVKVKTGQVVEGLMEVSHRDLKTGQEVVILGNEFLRDGAAVKKRNHQPQNPVPVSQ